MLLSICLYLCACLSVCIFLVFASGFAHMHTAPPKHTYTIRTIRTLTDHYYSNSLVLPSVLGSEGLGRFECLPGREGRGPVHLDLFMSANYYIFSQLAFPFSIPLHAPPPLTGSPKRQVQSISRESRLSGIQIAL